MNRLVLMGVFALSLWAVDVSMLSEEKQAALAQKAAAIAVGEKRLKNDWIGEFSLSASATQNQGAGSDESLRSDQASIGFSQDLFRSGGITGSIRYAGAWAQGERLMLEQTQNGYLQELALALLQHEQDRLRLLQNEHQLKSSEIALLIKKLQYEAGEADITQLNDALRDRNSLQKARLELKSTLAKRRLEMGKLTPLEPEKIPLPVYGDITRERYVEGNLAVRLAEAQSRTAKIQQDLTASNYLPTLSATASYGYQQNEGMAADGDSYSAGLKLTMPLSFTALSAIEEKKAEALRLGFQARSAQQEAAATYEQSADTLRSARESIDLLKENIRLYDELITVTKPAVDGGERSRYDLQTLENTRAADAYEIRLNEIALQIERAKLHYAMTHEKESHE